MSESLVANGTKFQAVPVRASRAAEAFRAGKVSGGVVYRPCPTRRNTLLPARAGGRAALWPAEQPPAAPGR